MSKTTVSDYESPALTTELWARTMSGCGYRMQAIRHLFGPSPHPGQAFSRGHFVVLDFGGVYAKVDACRRWDDPSRRGGLVTEDASPSGAK